MHFFNQSIETYSGPSSPSVNALFAPALSPIHYTDPGFLIIFYDRNTAKRSSIKWYNLPDYFNVLADKPLSTKMKFQLNVINTP
jgi:hypothetical protein